jgi:hypothetical protein
VGLAYLFRFNPYIKPYLFGASTFMLYGDNSSLSEDRLSNAVVAEYLLFAFIDFLLALLSTGLHLK